MLRLSEEKDIEVLRQAAMLLEAENARLLKQVTDLHRQLMVAKGEDSVALQLRLEALERQLAQRNQMLFGASSERRPAAETKPVSEPKPKKGHGPREQKELPVVERIFTLDEPDKVCPKCGGELREMKGQFEDAEEITVVQRQWVLQKIKRQKYRCSCGECIDTALGPPKLAEGSRYSVDFAIEVAAEKYLEHMPLERQVRKMGREGLKIESQTLWDQLNVLAQRLEPAHDRLHAHVLAQPVIGADETTWRLLDGKERCKWQVWALAAPDAVYYDILDSRSAKAAGEVLVDYAGVVMADGYSAYETLRREGGHFQLAHCWAHVRRKWIELETTFPAQAKRAIDLIGELYDIERLCPTGPPGDEMRRQLRDERSRPLVQAIHEFVRSTPAIPESGLAKAVEYTLGCWPGLVRFLEEPRIPIDNNATERALRGVVIGRKNHYGSKSQRGTEVAAIFYSLMESAKLAGVEPKAYLREACYAAIRGEPVPLPIELAAKPQ